VLYQQASTEKTTLALTAFDEITIKVFCRGCSERVVPPFPERTLRFAVGIAFSGGDEED
jgi:hypothetical protein